MKLACRQPAHAERYVTHSEQFKTIISIITGSTIRHRKKKCACRAISSDHWPLWWMMCKDRSYVFVKYFPVFGGRIKSISDNYYRLLVIQFVRGFQYQSSKVLMHLKPFLHDDLLFIAFYFQNGVLEYVQHSRKPIHNVLFCPTWARLWVSQKAPQVEAISEFFTDICSIKWLPLTFTHMQEGSEENRGNGRWAGKL